MKKIKTKKIGQKKILLYQKIALFTLVYLFIAVFFTTNIFYNTKQFLADIVNKNQTLESMLKGNVNSIIETSPIWPFRQVTNWSNVKDYEKTKWISFDTLSGDLKTNFPTGISDIVEKYKFITPYNIYTNISNPEERTKLSFYKRLLTVGWTSSYSCDTDNCKWWIKDTGTHQGVDIVTSINTPVYSIANGIVIKVNKNCGTSCSGFGNYAAVLSIVSGEYITTYYGHLNGLADISEGQIIKKGTLVGYVGNSGDATTTHLHLQINKVGNQTDSKTITLSSALAMPNYQSLDSIKQKTYNPISFIERNTINIPIATVETTKQDKDKQILQQISSKSKEDFQLLDVKFSKVENKVNLGDTITADITTTGSDGLITVNTSNDILKPSQYTLIPNGVDKYKLLILAQNMGKGELILDDGSTEKNYTFSVYDKDMSLYGLTVSAPDKFAVGTQEQVVITPIDKLGNKIDTFMNGKVKVILENNDTGTQTKVFESNNGSGSNKISFKLIISDVGIYSLKVYFDSDNKSLFVNKSISADIFKDYPTTNKFGSAVKYLYSKSIIRGSNNKLLPYDYITKWEVATVLGRYKYTDAQITQYNTKMLEYIKTKGKFYKDISGTESYAPYIFALWQDGFLSKDINFNPKNIVTMSQLIGFYGNFFDLYEYDEFNSFKDIKKTDYIKPFADTAKKYALYPFDDINYFKPSDKIQRVFAFESLYRYINLKSDISKVLTTTSSVSQTPTLQVIDVNGKTVVKSQDSQLEDVLRKLINF